MNTPELEAILRNAPQPAAPAGLRDRLLREAPKLLSPCPSENGRPRENPLRRWWPTLLVGGGVLACASTLLWQQGLLRELNARRATGSALPSPATLPVQEPSPDPSADTADLHTRQRAEIGQLRTEWEALQDAANRTRALEAENRELQARLASVLGVEAEDLQRLDEMRAKADSIRCINNLKQIGLALRVWATDNGGVFPGALMTVTNELSTPKVLVCSPDPADASWTDWTSFDAARISYEFLHPGGDESEPTRVIGRCRNHGHVLLSSGAVQMMPWTQDPRTLVSRNGALYFE
ncbi:MAG: hypothetical protein J0L84_13810 [Verrucomicrobia bacterium]|nr:hypothetical protein [Verrucomicrobiota bacterium]